MLEIVALFECKKAVSFNFNVFNLGTLILKFFVEKTLSQNFNIGNMNRVISAQSLLIYISNKKSR